MRSHFLRAAVGKDSRYPFNWVMPYSGWLVEYTGNTPDATYSGIGYFTDPDRVFANACPANESTSPSAATHAYMYINGNDRENGLNLEGGNVYKWTGIIQQTVNFTPYSGGSTLYDRTVYGFIHAYPEPDGQGEEIELKSITYSPIGSTAFDVDVTIPDGYENGSLKISVVSTNNLRWQFIRCVGQSWALDIVD